MEAPEGGNQNEVAVRIHATDPGVRQREQRQLEDWQPGRAARLSAAGDDGLRQPKARDHQDHPQAPQAQEEKKDDVRLPERSQGGVSTTRQPSPSPLW